MNSYFCKKLPRVGIIIQNTDTEIKVELLELLFGQGRSSSAIQNTFYYPYNFLVSESY